MSNATYALLACHDFAMVLYQQEVTWILKDETDQIWLSSFTRLGKSTSVVLADPILLSVGNCMVIKHQRTQSRCKIEPFGSLHTGVRRVLGRVVLILWYEWETLDELIETTLREGLLKVPRGRLYIHTSKKRETATLHYPLPR